MYSTSETSNDSNDYPLDFLRPKDSLEEVAVEEDPSEPPTKAKKQKKTRSATCYKKLPRLVELLFKFIIDLLANAVVYYGDNCIGNLLVMTIPVLATAQQFVGLKLSIFLTLLIIVDWKNLPGMFMSFNYNYYLDKFRVGKSNSFTLFNRIRKAYNHKHPRFERLKDDLRLRVAAFAIGVEDELAEVKRLQRRAIWQVIAKFIILICFFLLSTSFYGYDYRHPLQHNGTQFPIEAFLEDTLFTHPSILPTGSETSSPPSPPSPPPSPSDAGKNPNLWGFP